MTLTILGATGKTGVHVLRLALEAGHEVRALVRDPAKVGRTDDRLTLVQGDIRDAEAVGRAVAGSDAVISVLGPTSNAPETVVATGMAHVLEAMRAHDVRRLVVVAGAGVRAEGDTPKAFDRFMGMALRLAAKNVLRDMEKTVEEVRASDRAWTVVRVPMLTDGPATGEIRVGMVGQGTGPRIARADLAAFLLAQLEDETSVRASPVVSN